MIAELLLNNNYSLSVTLKVYYTNKYVKDNKKHSFIIIYYLPAAKIISGACILSQIVGICAQGKHCTDTFVFATLVFTLSVPDSEWSEAPKLMMTLRLSCSITASWPSDKIMWGASQVTAVTKPVSPHPDPSSRTHLPRSNDLCDKHHSARAAPAWNNSKLNCKNQIQILFTVFYQNPELTPG